MSEQMIAQVGKVELSAPAQKPAPVTVQPAQAAPTRPAAIEQAAAQEPKPVETQVKTAKGNSLQDVSLKFRIDAKTNDVTILILDRASRKVVRTIPPEEMNKMDPGELLEMFA